MNIIKASDYGIKNDSNITTQLIQLLHAVQNIEGAKTVIFEKGTYHIHSDEAVKRKLYITNSIADYEWKKDEEPHLLSIALNFQNIKDMIFDGQGSTFVMHGQMTNIAVSDCANLKLTNFAIRAINPDMHELKVVGKGLFHIDYELDSQSEYILKDNVYNFIGQDYCVPFNDCAEKSHWIARIREENLETICRMPHPLKGAKKLKELAKNKFRATYAFPKKFKIGDRYYLFDVVRKNAGIFAERCDNFEINNISQHFNYGLAFVCQDCCNINMLDCHFAPHPDDTKLMASVADFIQICVCRGLVNISGNFFQGTGDDCLNTHGVHFPIVGTDKEGYTTVKFAQCQTNGFNPLRVGDTVRFVDPHSLVGDETTTIISSELVSQYEIKLKLEDSSKADPSLVIEDISACPDLLFANNTMTRIITRGILVTTRGKVVIRKNHFANTFMNTIAIADDAKNWYESGSVHNVMIEENIFEECPEYNLYIRPENRIHKDYVHSNITVQNNIFNGTKNGGIYAKSASNILIKNNKTKIPLRITERNSQIKIEE